MDDSKTLVKDYTQDGSGLGELLGYKITQQSPMERYKFQDSLTFEGQNEVDARPVQVGDFRTNNTADRVETWSAGNLIWAKINEIPRVVLGAFPEDTSIGGAVIFINEFIETCGRLFASPTAGITFMDGTWSPYGDNLYAMGTPIYRWSDVYAVNLHGNFSGTVPGTLSSNTVTFANGVKMQTGTGDPEGSITAPQGSMFLRTNGGSATTIYAKTSGSGNTGWEPLLN